jgi:hypothetical protein
MVAGDSQLVIGDYHTLSTYGTGSERDTFVISHTGRGKQGSNQKFSSREAKRQVDTVQA